MARAARKAVTLEKPDLAKVKDFAQAGRTHSGVPKGSVRLSVNVRIDLHRKLKDIAYESDKTIGEMVEAWVESLPASTLRKRA